MPQFESMPEWLQRLLPIAMLLAVVAFVVSRQPKSELAHSPEFSRRRVMNWLPLGLTYAFLYMARYNLAAAKNDLGELIPNDDFGNIKALGTIVYGISFLVNGPLTDRIGGRATILIAAAGSALANVAMGAVLMLGVRAHLTSTFALLYALNMYFQSFGAVSIVKVNAAWFHLRERGTFGGIFGILISLGLYFAYDWCKFIAQAAETEWVFFIPAAILAVFFVLDVFMVRDTPGLAGHVDFDTGDGGWIEPVADGRKGLGPQVAGVFRVARMMLRQPAILIIAAVELCSGFLRSALMDWYTIFATQTGVSNYISENWGMWQCMAGILGGTVAGVVSDRVFGSRRGPVSGVLYVVMVVGSGLACLLLTRSGLLSVVVVVMMLAIIGVHGMLSGAASMDFGGPRNVGIVVGIIDGMVYMGQGIQYLWLGHLLPKGPPQAADPANWIVWPLAMLPVAILGVALSSRIWNSRPASRAAH
jgi:MFS transporter, OPA family, glycerol-3-phosphate transporter